MSVEPDSDKPIYWWSDRLVWVGALGYFVDTYDLVLFGVVRKASLAGLGVPLNQQMETGLKLIDCQMVGMLVGGIFWGILGDFWGRRSILFGSILMYSLANLLNAQVQDLSSYAILRFVAGFGLAGELGAAITLVSERLKADQRGYGTMLVAGVGISGAVVAALTGNLTDWRTSYTIGGLLGLALLALRYGTQESALFEKAQGVPRGFLGPLKLLLFSSRIWRFAACILTAVPIWFVAGILVLFAPELGEALNCPQPLVAANAVFFLYLGATIGDFLAGALSQWWATRKGVVLACHLALAACCLFFLLQNGASATRLYWTYLALGLATGYWSLFVSWTAEIFGTDVRATATTSAPNFVRGAVVPITWAVHSLKGYGLIYSCAVVGIVCFGLAILSAALLPETFGRNLDFSEAEIAR